VAREEKENEYYSPCRKCGENKGYTEVFDERTCARELVCNACGHTETIGFGVIA